MKQAVTSINFVFRVSFQQIFKTILCTFLKDKSQFLAPLFSRSTYLPSLFEFILTEILFIHFDLPRKKYKNDAYSLQKSMEQPKIEQYRIFSRIGLKSIQNRLSWDFVVIRTCIDATYHCNLQSNAWLAWLDVSQLESPTEHSQSVHLLIEIKYVQVIDHTYINRSNSCCLLKFYQNVNALYRTYIRKIYIF